MKVIYCKYLKILSSLLFITFIYSGCSTGSKSTETNVENSIENNGNKKG